LDVDLLGREEYYLENAPQKAVRSWLWTPHDSRGDGEDTEREGSCGEHLPIDAFSSEHCVTVIRATQLGWCNAIVWM
jgi:hypothetical protein